MALDNWFNRYVRVSRTGGTDEWQAILERRTIHTVIAGGGVWLDCGGCLPQAQMFRAVFCRAKQKYGGMEVSEAKRIKELNREKSLLKNTAAEQALDIRILRDVILSSGERGVAERRRCVMDFVIQPENCGLGRIVSVRTRLEGASGCD